MCKLTSEIILQVHPVNQLRHTLGVHAHLIQELRQDEERFFKYFRMSIGNFDYLLGLVTTRLTKKDTVMRAAIKPNLKLALTLHHLAEESSITSIAFHYRLGKSTALGIVAETCQVIYDCLQPLYMQPPSGPRHWQQVAQGSVL